MWTWIRYANEAVSAIREAQSESEKPPPYNKARFTMTHDDMVFECDECNGQKFIKVSDFKARCAKDDCGVVYSVEFNMLDLNILYYEG